MNELVNANEAIAVINDEYRRHPRELTLTSGVVMIPDVSELLQAVAAFDDFDEENDPYGEHDFGSLYWYGMKIFWKIDYYDAELKNWSDPLDPRTRRVLTVMLASEY